MKHIKQLSFEIETNRQRLHFAIETGNDDLVNRISLLLTHLLASYYDATKDYLDMGQNEKFYLVFCDEYPDGLRVNGQGYQALLKTMTRFDRETHVVVDIPDGCELIADEMIEISSMPKPWKTDRKGA